MPQGNKFDVILAFAFGAPADLKPNRYIASYAMQLSRSGASGKNLPVFTQRDVPVPVLRPEIYFAEKKKGYLSRLDIIEAFLEKAREKNWRTSAVVVAPPMWCGTFMALSKLTRLRQWPMVFIYPPNLSFLPEADWFDRKSDQRWTRRKSLWQIKETAFETIVMPLIK